MFDWCGMKFKPNVLAKRISANGTGPNIFKSICGTHTKQSIILHKEKYVAMKFNDGTELKNIKHFIAVKIVSKTMLQTMNECVEFNLQNAFVSLISANYHLNDGRNIDKN